MLKIDKRRLYVSLSLVVIALNGSPLLAKTFNVSLDDKVNVIVSYNDHTESKNINGKKAIKVGLQFASQIWDYVCIHQQLKLPCSPEPNYYTIRISFDYSSGFYNTNGKLGTYSCSASLFGKGSTHRQTIEELMPKEGKPPISYIEEASIFRCYVAPTLEGLISIKNPSGYSFIYDTTDVPDIRAKWR